jgi:DNA-binding response OmpR family regulator
MTPDAKARKRVLIVDDEPLVAESIRQMLASGDYELRIANTTQQALELFGDGAYDVVITDFDLPDLKGDKLAVLLKQKAAHVRIIMVTVYAEVLGASRSIPDVDIILSKPFGLQELRQAVSGFETG